MTSPANDDNQPWLDLGTYSSFLAYQSPLPVSWVAAMRGLGTGPLSEDFTYLELNAGQALSLALLADSYPSARFIGVEPDAGQARRAEALKHDSGLANIDIHHAPLADVGALKLPACDIATLSGLYSWYSAEKRAALVQTFANALKPGGFLCVQYGALPGNAHSDLTFFLLKSLAAAQDGDDRQKLGKAIQRTIELARAGALFFKQVPDAAELLSKLPESDAMLAMREILYNEGQSLSHIAVADEMSACGLSYVGSGQVERNSMELVAPPALRGIIEATKGQAVRELMLDYAMATGARIDIYAKPGGSAREPADAMAPFLLARFKEGDETLLRQQIAQRSGVDFTAGLYDDLLRLIGKTPMSVQEVLDHADMRRHARARILRALQMAVGLHLIQLVRTRTTIAQGPLPEKVKLASRFNEQILERWLARNDVAPLSNTVSGMRVTIGAADRFRLHALLDRPLEPALKKVTDTGASFTDNEAKPMTPEAFRDLVTTSLPQYRARDAIVFYTLGVLVPA